MDFYCCYLNQKDKSLRLGAVEVITGLSAKYKCALVHISIFRVYY